jgi:hypothetical protein
MRTSNRPVYKKKRDRDGIAMIGFENTDNYNLGEKAEYHPTQQ